eukprot:3793338-Amphidinium_carterae.1
MEERFADMAVCKCVLRTRAGLQWYRSEYCRQFAASLLQRVSIQIDSHIGAASRKLAHFTSLRLLACMLYEYTVSNHIHRPPEFQGGNATEDATLRNCASTLALQEKFTFIPSKNMLDWRAIRCILESESGKELEWMNRRASVELAQ